MDLKYAVLRGRSLGPAAAVAPVVDDEPQRLLRHERGDGRHHRAVNVPVGLVGQVVDPVLMHPGGLIGRVRDVLGRAAGRHPRLLPTVA